MTGRVDSDTKLSSVQWLDAYSCCSNLKFGLLFSFFYLFHETKTKERGIKLKKTLADH